VRSFRGNQRTVTLLPLRWRHRPFADRLSPHALAP
jgi:hypothetical protein